MSELIDPSKNEQQETKWKRFEKLVYEIQKSLTGTKATVTHKDYIMGKTSNVEREIDISIKQQVAQFPILVVIDCKDYAKPVDMKTVEEFAGLYEDVRANKGVMVASNGFTPAAITVAKSKGIDTLTLIDSEGVDWKTYIAVTVLLEDILIDKCALRVSGAGGWMVPQATEELMDIPMYSDDGTLIGTPRKIIQRKWRKEEIPQQPGIHQTELGKQVNIEYRGMKSKIDISAQILVRKDCYLGPLQVYSQGFHNAQDDSLIIKRQLTTDGLNPTAIARGEVPGWRKIDNTKDETISCMMRFGVVTVYGEDEE